LYLSEKEKKKKKREEKERKEEEVDDSRTTRQAKHQPVRSPNDEICKQRYKRWKTLSES